MQPKLIKSEVDPRSNMKKHVFISGLHRSGTSVLHRIICTSTDVTGFENTNVPEDEGQHLQSVFKPALCYGGAGKFALRKEARLDESSDLINTLNREKLNAEWSNYWDEKRPVKIEKSPPNLIRTRFLQAMFPESYFITIIRHPLPVSFATQRRTKQSLDELILHWLEAYQCYQKDSRFLKNEIFISYEALNKDPLQILSSIEKFIDIKINYKNQLVNKNEEYFKIWNRNKWWKLSNRNKKKIVDKYEKKINEFGYSLAQTDRFPIFETIL